MPSYARLAAPLLLLPLVAGCAGGAADAGLEVERYTAGDTTVVRTVSGSAWGAPARLEPELTIGTFEGAEEYMLGDVAGIAVAPDGSIYVYDRQVPALRKYNSDGEYVQTFGGEGGGPGEYKNSDGGLAVLPDGRVLLRDPGNGRINVYSPDGEVLDHWDMRGGFFTSRPLFVDTAGTAYTQIWGSLEDGERYDGLRPVNGPGAGTDSLLAPEWDVERATLTFSSDRMQMVSGVPFSPRDMWTFSPLGYYVGGVSSRYAVESFLPNGKILRLEREVEPVPVQPDEKANSREIMTARFRQNAPDWKWDGPPIPDTKPAFRDIAAGRDGRLWVQLSDDAERLEGVEEGPTAPGEVPAERWREPVVWDVFEPDGSYLGQVRAPDGLQTYPAPVFDGDAVWAVTVDDLDVEYVTRFRVVRGGVDDAGADA